MVCAVCCAACAGGASTGPPTLKWYVYNEQSGAFAEAARRCGQRSDGRYRIALTPLPTSSDQQREQLVRRLAARDPDIDLVGMDVVWVPEFGAAGWILPWRGAEARRAEVGRLRTPLATARFRDTLWAVPLTTNVQLLWYRTDRVAHPPTTWDQMLRMAEALGDSGTIEAQGQRYEGLTVFFTSLLASAGGRVLGPGDTTVALPDEPTRRALGILKRLAVSSAADPSLATSREDQNRLAFQTGKPTFMVNYTYVWPSAHADAPNVARHMGWARWPAVSDTLPSRVTIGGVDVGVGAWTRHPKLAFDAALCLASKDNQRLYAVKGGLPPTDSALYDDPDVRRVFPFADVLRATLRDAVQRARTPLYTDVSLAIARTIHPLANIDSIADVAKLRAAVWRALHSQGLS